MNYFENRNQFDIDRYNYQIILNRYEEQQISTVSSLTIYEENLFQNYRISEEFYQKIKEKLLIKMKFLDQNRVRHWREEKEKEKEFFSLIESNLKWTISTTSSINWNLFFNSSTTIESLIILMKILFLMSN